MFPGARCTHGEVYRRLAQPAVAGPQVDHQVAAHLVQADHHGAGGTHGLDCNKLVVGTGTYQLLRTIQIQS